MNQYLSFVLATAAVVTAIAAVSLDPKSPTNYIPKLGEFPPAGVGIYHAGELISVDAINRRCVIRILGNRDMERYHSSDPQEVVLLPYATVRYHGAPAELRDIPIGTVVHAYCVFPLGHSLSTPRPRGYAEPQTHAVTFEDSFSFYERRGQRWKIESIQKGKLNVVSTGPAEGDGPLGKRTFSYDASTRVWKGKQIATVADLAPEQIVHFNFTWDANWGMGGLQALDVWTDEESRTAAAEVQRQIHIRYMRFRWLPGWVDHVEDQGAGKGIVTITLFDNCDPSLYEQLKSSKNLAIAVSDPTLRTWLHAYDSKSGPLLELKKAPRPPFGHSGLTVRVPVSELLEGFRPGRIVRVRPDGFPAVKLPPDERIRH